MTPYCPPRSQKPLVGEMRSVWAPLGAAATVTFTFVIGTLFVMSNTASVAPAAGKSLTEARSMGLSKSIDAVDSSGNPSSLFR
jgi:hypothetical protein